MSSIDQIIVYRTKLLDIIQECNKKLGFEGNRGEHLLDEDRLLRLAEELTAQIPDEGGDIDEITDTGNNSETPKAQQPGEKDTGTGQSNS